MRRPELLTTGQVAEMLGCSRQHVVDLCNEGKLPSQSTGVHRRLLRADVEAYRNAREPRREDLRSLWISRAVAGKLTQDPDRVLRVARRNLARFARIHAGSPLVYWLDEWRKVMALGPEAVLRVLTSDSEYARDMRQSSPFAGVLSETERRRIIEAFRRTWSQSAA